MENAPTFHRTVKMSDHDQTLRVLVRPPTPKPAAEKSPKRPFEQTVENLPLIDIGDLRITGSGWAENIPISTASW
jgi:hypothetical protein